MRLLRTVCVLGLALCLATSVYAGTQSVKLSGELTIRGIARGDYDLDRNHGEPVTGPSTAAQGFSVQSGTSDWQDYFMTTTEVQLDADLTDNVSAVIRIFNQRDWDVDQTITPQQNMYNTYTTNPDEFQLGVNLAYIELKEFLYSPLSLRIGRQNLWFGKGFIVGRNMRDPTATINANEYTCMISFDAIRATLDYDPWTIDAIAAKIWEHNIGSKDDVDLYGLNVGYLFDVYNAEMEGYWFQKDDRGTVGMNTTLKQHNIVNTIGIRGSCDPIENWTVAVEGAYQFGHAVVFERQLEKRGRSAYAIDAMAECRYFKEMFAWKPVISGEYILYSGDRHEYPTEKTPGDYGNWDMMYRGKFDTAYREFVGGFNVTHMANMGRRLTSSDLYVDNSTSNQHQVLVTGSIMPTDSFKAEAKAGFFWQMYRRAFLENQLDPAAPIGNAFQYNKRPLYMGTEVDIVLTWDYTEDVQFGLLGAWFMPGAFYNSTSDDTATDIVGTVKLTF